MAYGAKILTIGKFKANIREQRALATTKKALVKGQLHTWQYVGTVAGMVEHNWKCYRCLYCDYLGYAVYPHTPEPSECPVSHGKIRFEI